MVSIRFEPYLSNMKIWCYQKSLYRSNYLCERFGKLTFQELDPSSEQIKRPIIRSDEGLMLETSTFQIFHQGNLTFSNSFDKNNFHVSLSH